MNMRLWLSRTGFPTVQYWTEYDSQAREFRVRLRQTGFENKPLLDQDPWTVPLSWAVVIDGMVIREGIHVMSHTKDLLVIPGVPVAPDFISLGRQWSFYGRLKHMNATDRVLKMKAVKDPDAYNRLMAFASICETERTRLVCAIVEEQRQQRRRRRRLWDGGDANSNSSAIGTNGTKSDERNSLSKESGYSDESKRGVGVGGGGGSGDDTLHRTVGYDDDDEDQKERKEMKGSHGQQRADVIPVLHAPRPVTPGSGTPFASPFASPYASPYASPHDRQQAAGAGTGAGATATPSSSSASLSSSSASSSSSSSSSTPTTPTHARSFATPSTIGRGGPLDAQLAAASSYARSLSSPHRMMNMGASPSNIGGGIRGGGQGGSGGGGGGGGDVDAEHKASTCYDEPHDHHHDHQHHHHHHHHHHPHHHHSPHGNETERQQRPPVVHPKVSVQAGRHHVLTSPSSSSSSLSSSSSSSSSSASALLTSSVAAMIARDTARRNSSTALRHYLFNQPPRAPLKHKNTRLRSKQTSTSSHSTPQQQQQQQQMQKQEGQQHGMEATHDMDKPPAGRAPHADSAPLRGGGGGGGGGGSVSDHTVPHPPVSISSTTTATVPASASAQTATSAPDLQRMTLRCTSYPSSYAHSPSPSSSTLSCPDGALVCPLVDADMMVSTETASFAVPSGGSDRDSRSDRLTSDDLHSLSPAVLESPIARVPAPKLTPMLQPAECTDLRSRGRAGGRADAAAVGGDDDDGGDNDDAGSFVLQKGSTNTEGDSTLANGFSGLNNPIHNDDEGKEQDVRSSITGSSSRTARGEMQQRSATPHLPFSIPRSTPRHSSTASAFPAASRTLDNGTPQLQSGLGSGHQGNHTSGDGLKGGSHVVFGRSEKYASVGEGEGEGEEGGVDGDDNDDDDDNGDGTDSDNLQHTSFAHLSFSSHPPHPHHHPHHHPHPHPHPHHPHPQPPLPSHPDSSDSAPVPHAPPHQNHQSLSRPAHKVDQVSGVRLLYSRVHASIIKDEALSLGVRGRLLEGFKVGTKLFTLHLLSLLFFTYF